MQNEVICNPRELRNFKRVSWDISLRAIREELLANEVLWGVSTKRQESLRVQRETSSIFLRGARCEEDIVDPRDVQEVCNSQLAPSFPRTLTWLATVAQALQGQLARSLFSRLPPMTQVYKHVDEGAYYAQRDRYHLVIHSTGGSQLTSGDESVVMHEGELWWFDNKKPHEAFNRSSTPRVHLIFDIEPHSR